MTANKLAPIVRKVDELGRIVLPIEFRGALGVSKGSAVALKMLDNQLIIEKYSEQCSHCQALASEKRLYSVEDRQYCQDCLKSIANTFKQNYESTLTE